MAAERAAVVPVNLAQKLGLFSEHWSPRIVGALNGQYVKLVKLKDAFVWHHHEDEDELFLVLHGVLRMDLEAGPVTVRAGEFVIVPRGVRHRPVAEDGEVHVLLFEPASTVSTGSADDARATHGEWI